jgi:hypothetical protein
MFSMDDDSTERVAKGVVSDIREAEMDLQNIESKRREWKTSDAIVVRCPGALSFLISNCETSSRRRLANQRQSSRQS